ncbi:DUF1905 domain-containing protein [Temperatibacter marinus]|uniref:DUF1905 domain-containing protein n=1 Tax=Temperatibacter marinus TaxID=1456591 RepID=A0AA52ED57_9PROT|nr:DUF1905 domain-containing protein [Temperatibacter marinus]WND02581.1 DUF1905 domain-containing protein [Temperatibacter marinus]
MFDLEFTFTARIWLWTAEKASWHFVTLPKENADQVKMFQPSRRGFGSVKVDVQIGETQWSTSIFPSKETDSYILPIKAAVRKSEKLGLDESVDLTIRLASNL